MSGYIPVNRMFLKISLRGKTIDPSHKDNILAEISSGPLDLFISRPRIRERISSSLTGILLNFASV